MGGYCYTLNKLLDIVAATHRKKLDHTVRAVAAINKPVFLDMGLTMTAYNDENSTQFKEKLNTRADDLINEPALPALHRGLLRDLDPAAARIRGLIGTRTRARR